MATKEIKRPKQSLLETEAEGNIGAKETLWWLGKMFTAQLESESGCRAAESELSLSKQR